MLRQTVLDTTDARRPGRVLPELLGLHYRPGHEPPPPGEDDPNGREWLVLRNPGGNQLAFQQVDELTPSTWPEPGVPQQLHLDLTVATREALASRARSRARARAPVCCGTTRQDEVEPIYVYADPAGHPFCIFVAPPPRPPTRSR